MRVLHHCLTGQVPYPVAQELDAVSAHLLDPPPRPSAIDPRLPRALDAVVERAMSKDPAARFPSAGDLANAADAAARGEPAPQHEHSVATGAAAPRPPAPPPWRAPRRPRGRVLAAGIAAAGGAAALAVIAFVGDGSGGDRGAPDPAVAAARPLRVAGRCGR
jgi:hypothetical protein